MSTVSLVRLGALSVCPVLLTVVACNQHTVEQPWALAERREEAPTVERLPEVSPSDGTFRITVPLGLDQEQVAISAAGPLHVGARAKVMQEFPRNSKPLYGFVTSLKHLRLDSGAEVGNAYSLGNEPVVLGDGAKVHGFLKSGGAVPEAYLRRIRHGFIENALRDAEAFSWHIDFNASPTSSQVVAPKVGYGEALPPGSYRSLRITPHASTRITSGQYKFHSLRVDESGVLEIDNTRGAVYVWVRDELIIEGVVQEYFLGANILIGYGGKASPTIRSPLRATLVAPASEVHLRAEDIQHRGAVFAHAVSLADDVEFVHTPFRTWYANVRDREDACRECANAARVVARDCCRELQRRASAMQARADACQASCATSEASDCQARCELTASLEFSDANADYVACKERVDFKYSSCLIQNSYRPYTCEYEGHSDIGHVECMW